MNLSQYVPLNKGILNRSIGSTLILTLKVSDSQVATVELTKLEYIVLEGYTVLYMSRLVVPTRFDIQEHGAALMLELERMLDAYDLYVFCDRKNHKHATPFYEWYNFVPITEDLLVRVPEKLRQGDVVQHATDALIGWVNMTDWDTMVKAVKYTQPLELKPQLDTKEV